MEANVKSSKNGLDGTGRDGTGLNWTLVHSSWWTSMLHSETFSVLNVHVGGFAVHSKWWLFASGSAMKKSFWVDRKHGWTNSKSDRQMDVLIEYSVGSTFTTTTKRGRVTVGGFLLFCFFTSFFLSLVLVWVLPFGSLLSRRMICRIIIMKWMGVVKDEGKKRTKKGVNRRWVGYGHERMMVSFNWTSSKENGSPLGAPLLSGKQDWYGALIFLTISSYANERQKDEQIFTVGPRIEIILVD